MAAQQTILKSLFFPEDSIENRISYYLLAFFVIMLPFDRFYTEFILIIFLVHTTIHVRRDRLKNVFTLNTLLLSSMFIVALIGLSYSQEKSQGINNLGKQLAVILFPILLASCGLNLKKYVQRLLLIFSLTCTITLIYLYVYAIYLIHYNDLGWSTLFSRPFINHNFSEPIGLHATYFAMYCLLSASALFYLLLRETNKIMRIIFTLSLLVLLAGLLQLASRAVLISALLIAILLPFLVFNRAGRAQSIIILAGILTVTGILIMNVSSFKLRYVAEFKNDLTQESVNNEVLEPRITRWNYILINAVKSPLIGYGTGSEQKLLNQIYFDNKLFNSYLHQLNSHNQYLGVFVETGLWGLLIFLLTLFIGLATAIKQKNIFFLSFLVIVCIVSFSENILGANKGIFFYSFFFSLFALSGKPFYQLLRFNRKQLSVKSTHASPVRSHNNV